jgi:hypothetical protein
MGGLPDFFYRPGGPGNDTVGSEETPTSRPKSSLIGAAVRAFSQGATSNWADEMGAKLASAIPGQPSEDAILAKSRAENAQAHADHPWAWPLAKVAGTMAMASRFPAAASTLGAAGTAGVWGGLSAAGESEGSPSEKLKTGAWGAGLGAILGGILGPGTNRYIDEAPERALASRSASSLAAEKKAIMEKLQGPPSPDKGELLQRLEIINQGQGRAMESKGGFGLGKASAAAAMLGHPIAAAAGIGIKVADYGATQAMAALTNAVRNGKPLAKYVSDAFKAGIPAATINQIAPTAADYAPKAYDVAKNTLE